MSEIEFGKHRKLVKSLVDQGKAAEALKLCGQLLTQLPQATADVLRLRAYVYALGGRYTEAIADRNAVIASGEGMLRDYYQLGDNALSAGRFEDASRWLQEALRLGRIQSEPWFESAALLLLSYAKMELGQLQEASETLERAVAIDPECAMPIRGHGVITHQSLRDEIMRRAESKPR
jgi:tetratricopeptide (TPR) repeat protein